MDNYLLSINGLSVFYQRASKGFFSKKLRCCALDNVSLHLSYGETLGIVGESGSGKTTLGRSIIRLVPIDSGEIYFNDRCISALSDNEFFPYRKKIQMIFQDPFDSLNHRMTVEQILREPLDIHFKHLSKKQKYLRILDLLEKVHLPKNCLKHYPHEFSGGQCQRIGIARALSVEPQLLICDEPVSALDVSIQSQIVNLLKDLQEQLGLSYLFISHDMAIVRYISDAVAVIHHGKIVEYDSVKNIYNNPKDDYTKKLLSSVPEI